LPFLPFLSHLVWSQKWSHLFRAIEEPCLQSEQSLLSIILPAHEFATLVSRFQKAVREHLIVLGASLQDVEREAAAMHQIELAPTVSRSVRGSIRELTFAVEDELQRYISTYIHIHHGCDWDALPL
jgi:hypothetical protein